MLNQPGLFIFLCLQGIALIRIGRESNVRTEVTLNIHLALHPGGPVLQLTKDGEYAVRAMLYLASQPEGKAILVPEISEAQEVPRSYLSKIMQDLAKSGLVRSRRGAKGGFFLARPASLITLREVIEAIEGPINLNICLIKKGECPQDKACPVHPVWKEAQSTLFEVLDSKSMAQLVKDAGCIVKFIREGGE